MCVWCGVCGVGGVFVCGVWCVCVGWEECLCVVRQVDALDGWGIHVGRVLCVGV